MEEKNTPQALKDALGEHLLKMISQEVYVAYEKDEEGNVEQYLAPIPAAYLTNANAFLKTFRPEEELPTAKQTSSLLEKQLDKELPFNTVN